MFKVEAEGFLPEERYYLSAKQVGRLEEIFNTGSGANKNLKADLDEIKFAL